jgi:DnaK suppressor protein
MSASSTPAASVSSQAAHAVQLGAEELTRLRAELEQSQTECRDELQALVGSPIAEHDLVAAARLESVRRVLAEVKAALQRIDAGRFGTCRHCGAAIPPARLELLPRTSGCVDCLRRQASRR